MSGASSPCPRSVALRLGLAAGVGLFRWLGFGGVWWKLLRLW
jgi:hypothetical protein